ncbi:hypothetical protein QR721_11660 [Aciduricibacillus chroicocephali]|uniref:Uncharacterized protein n=1 Tax=Aciduricibacillus chroicocephali TaxID=3054939 RepID=A0ABY9KU77_9BACI|nr:hypothetical protein QR721_11660 [Bacillaceae bacterium 44XB]
MEVLIVLQKTRQSCNSLSRIAFTHFPSKLFALSPIHVQSSIKKVYYAIQLIVKTVKKQLFWLGLILLSYKGWVAFEALQFCLWRLKL